MAQTTLINVEEGHSKFYEVAVYGRGVRMSWGRIGKTPQTQFKKFSYAGAAHDFAYDKIQAKLAHGYRVVNPDSF